MEIKIRSSTSGYRPTVKRKSNMPKPHMLPKPHDKAMREAVKHLGSIK